MTWGEALAWASEQVGPNDARWIVEEASGWDGGTLRGHLDEKVTVRCRRHLESMVARRVAGEPLQYVLGRWGFRGLDLAVDPRVLIPRPETEGVVEVALAELDRATGGTGAGRVLDLGTGSGAIALSICAERVRSQVWAVEVCPDAIKVARANAAGLGRAAARLTILEGSWFEPLRPELRATFDLIVSNPPYVANDDQVEPVVAEWEPAGALWSGPDGLDAVREILAGISDWLAPGGSFVCEVDPRRAEVAADLVAATGLGEITLVDDLAGRPRVLRARRAGSHPRGGPAAP
jgi:release factor glutamine methyltransferase